jgi:hypothetical protein
VLVVLLAASLTVAGGPATAASPFPLRTEGTRLVDASGRDFVIIGDAAWTLFVGTNLDEAEIYLEARRAAGFNTVLVELFEKKTVGPRNRRGDAPFPAERPFTELSPAYFDQVRAVLDLTVKHGFLVLLSHAYVGYRCEERQGWCNEMKATPDAVLEAFGREVATLLAGYPNLVWVHGGDVDAKAYGVMDKVEAVYRGIASVLPSALHTAHCARNFSAVDCYDHPWLNVNTTYSDCEQTADRVVRDRERVTRMPSFYIEGRYEEERSTPACVRAQLWWSLLGGSVGHVFGNKRIWRSDPGWRAALDTPGTRAMGVASRLVSLQPAGGRLAPIPASRPVLEVDGLASAWERLWSAGGGAREAWSTLADGPGAVLSATIGESTLSYLSRPTRFRYEGPARVFCWIDPRNGAVLPERGDAASLRSPGDEDALFVAEPAARLCARNSL